MRGEKRGEKVYAMPDGALDWWEAVTGVPCPVEGCEQTVVWYEAGYVPGYRVCVYMAPTSDGGGYALATLRHRFLAGAARCATLIRDLAAESRDRP